MTSSAPERPTPLDVVRGFMSSRVLLTAVELRLFDCIDQGSTTAEAISSELDTDLRATERLLNALAGTGWLTKTEEGEFANTVEAWRFLVQDSVECQLGALRHYANMWHSWSTLTEVVRSGVLVRERPPYATSDDYIESFMAAMEQFARQRAPRVVKSVDLSEAERILDVGCGPGIYSIEFCKRYPQLKATAFDLPPVLPLTQQHIDDAGLSGRIETQVGDYNVDELGSGYDLVLLSSILHSNGEEQNRSLLAKAFAALVPGGGVLIQEFIPDASKAYPPMAALFGINMLVNTDRGDVFSQEQMTAWLADCGFGEVQRLDSIDEGDWLIAWKPSD